MAIPASVVVVVFASFAIGIFFAFVAAMRGQLGRPGALLGLVLGAPLSIPAGVFAGILFWSMVEEAPGIPDQLGLMIGPVIGSFIGTFLVALMTREIGSRTAAGSPRCREREESTPPSSRSTHSG